MHNLPTWPATLALLLEKHHLTQEMLAEKIDVTPGTIGHYLTGRRRPSIKRLEILMRFFGVSASYLLNGKEEGKEVEDEGSNFIHIPIFDNLMDIIQFNSTHEVIKTTRTKKMARQTGFIPSLTSYALDITDDEALPHLLDCKIKLPYAAKIIAIIEPAIKPHLKHTLICGKNGQIHIYEYIQSGSKKFLRCYSDKNEKCSLEDVKYLGTIVSFLFEYEPE